MVSSRKSELPESKSKVIELINQLAFLAKNDIEQKEILWIKFLPLMKKSISILYLKFNKFIDIDFDTFFNDLISESYIIFDRHVKRWDPSRFDFLGYWKFVYIFELNIVARDSYFKNWRINTKFLTDFSSKVKFVQKSDHLNEFDFALEIDDNFEDRILIRNAIDQLSKLYRNLIVFYYFDGLIQREIADKLNMHVTTVCSELKRAKRALFDILKEEYCHDASDNGKTADFCVSKDC